MERVLGIDGQPDDDAGRTEVINLAARPWLVGVTLSAIQLTVDAGTVRPRRRRQRY